MNYLNLDPKRTEATVEQLNVLLADYHIYYQKLRNFHWNVVGENFFDLHEKFEEMYNDTLIKIDEIAERILTLRYQPVSHLSEYLKIDNILARKISGYGKENTSEELLRENIYTLIDCALASSSLNKDYFDFQI